MDAPYRENDATTNTTRRITPKAAVKRIQSARPVRSGASASQSQ